VSFITILRRVTFQRYLYATNKGQSQRGSSDKQYGKHSQNLSSKQWSNISDFSHIGKVTVGQLTNSKHEKSQRRTKQPTKLIYYEKVLIYYGKVLIYYGKVSIYFSRIC
jgi:hypothetical protein